MLEKRLRIDDTPCPAKHGAPRGNGSHLPHPGRKQMLTRPPFEPPLLTLSRPTTHIDLPGACRGSVFRVRKARRAEGAAPALPTVAPRE